MSGWTFLQRQKVLNIRWYDHSFVCLNEKLNWHQNRHYHFWKMTSKLKRILNYRLFSMNHLYYMPMSIKFQFFKSFVLLCTEFYTIFKENNASSNRKSIQPFDQTFAEFIHSRMDVVGQFTCHFVDVVLIDWVFLRKISWLVGNWKLFANSQMFSSNNRYVSYCY